MEDYEDSPWKIRVGAKQGEKTRSFFSRCMGIFGAKKFVHHTPCSKVGFQHTM